MRISPIDSDQIEILVRSRRPNDHREVLAVLNGNDALAGLAENPFLLSSMIELNLDVLHDVRGKADLMGHLLAEAIGKADAEHRAEMEGAVPFLSQVAYRMVRSWRIGNESPLEVRSSEERHAATVLAATPLVVERDGAHYFQHQIFQEYLAANHLATRRRARRPVRLLLDRRWSEIIVLWIQLDERPRAGRLTRRCLNARNLPWRRPRLLGNPAVIGFDIFVGMFLFAFLGAAVLTLILGPASTLPAPTAWLGLSSFAVLIVLLVTRFLAKSLSVHGGIASNAAYALATAGEVSELRYIFRSFRTTNSKQRADVAASVGGMGAPVIEHAERGLRSSDWRIRAGSVLSLGSLASRSPELVDNFRPLLRGAAECNDRVSW